VLDLAAGVIEASSREQPADAVLRAELRARRSLSSDKRRRTSEAVFAYFRWRGWLDQDAAMSKQLRDAQALRRQFADSPQSFPDAELLARAVPAWVSAFMEVTPAWVRALQAEPVLWLRARPGQGKALASRLGHCEPAGAGLLADALRYDGEEDLFRTAGFQEGEFQIQDLHSQAVGWLCAPQPGEMWWDACAGEGGKLLHLSDLMQNRGLIWASDEAEWRLRRLKLRARRAGVFNYRLAVWDGGERLPTRTKFDGVLVDAPCSNLGTWGRNPHARWTTTPQDVQELAALQRRLLDHAASALKPGGRLVHAVCTLTREETSGLAGRFGAAHPAFEPLPLADPLRPAQPPAPNLFLRPEWTSGNGVYVASWRCGERPREALGVRRLSAALDG
jgi:16S rRNA (cytosine967-C5)-methyltransferase